MIAYMLSTVFPSALSRTGTAMAMLFSLSCAIALSFNYNFDMISNSIKLVDRHTSLFQFMILWLIHILVPLALVVLVIFTKRQAFKRNKLPVTPARQRVCSTSCSAHSASPAPSGRCCSGACCATIPSSLSAFWFTASMRSRRSVTREKPRV